MNTRFEEKLKVIPEIPKEFGEDGGRFYRYYDTLADEIDEDMVKSLKAQLDGILIFAGLFAGVNSAFLALTLPEMSADPADDTNALLLQFVTGGNGSIRSADDLPSASFSPASSILPINILFSLSLSFALLAAFLAVLGQQWLVYYRKRSGGGADAQRWEQLRRYLGAKRWRLEAILDDILPSLLQLGLVIFCISFVLYLGTLNGPMCYTVAVSIGLALVCIVLMAVCAACDHWCPFKSPLSHLFQLIPGPIAKLGWRTVLLLIHWASAVLSKGKHLIITATRRLGPVAMPVIRSCTSRTLTTFRRAGHLISKVTHVLIHRPSEGGDASEDGDTSRDGDTWPKLVPGSTASWLAENVPRRAEPVGRLKSMAAKRMICTSEDTNALLYAAVNLQAITSPEEAGWLLSDDEFYSRLSEPWQLDYRVLSQIQSSDPRAAEIVAFSNSLLHLILSSTSVTFLLPPDERSLAPSHTLDENTRVKNLPLALRDIGVAINYVPGLKNKSSCPGCTHCIVPSLLAILIGEDYLTVSRYEMGVWFEQFSTYLVHLTEEPPMLTYLLAHAVQAYGKLASEPRRITAEEFRERIWHAVYKMSKIYHKCDASEALDHALEVFPTVDSPSRPSDGVCVILLERAPALLKTGLHRFNAFELIAKHAMGLFQNIIRRENCNQSAKPTEKDPVARCIKVLVWTFVHVKVSLGIYGFPDFVIKLSRELKVCLNSAEQTSTRKPSTVDVSVFLNFLRIRDELMSPAEYAEHPAHSWYKKDTSSYKSAYDELVTSLARLESAVFAVQRTTDPVMVNPADPFPIRVDGRNLPYGKFSCYLPM